MTTALPILAPLFRFAEQGFPGDRIQVTGLVYFDGAPDPVAEDEGEAFGGVDGAVAPPDDEPRVIPFGVHRQFKAVH